MLSALAQLRLLGAVATPGPAVPGIAAAGTDYKALVCIFLAGGNDSNNMIIPTLNSEYGNYSSIRGANLALLRSWNLTPAAHDLPGIHPSLGNVTLRQLLSAWVVHDLGHVAQVARVMAKQLRREVGPWEPFLPVLTDHETPRS